MASFEQLLKGFRRNVNQGITSSLVYDGEQHVQLTSELNKGHHGLAKIPKKTKKGG